MSEKSTSGRLVNIVTITVSLLGIGLLFSPAKFENEGMDFLLSILQGFKFDILFFVVLAVVIWKFDSIRSFYKKQIQARPPFVKKLVALSLVVLILLNFYPLYQLAKYRIFLYQNYHWVYKKELYSRLCTAINEGNYLEVPQLVEKIKTNYRNESYKIEHLTDQYRSLVDGAEKYYPLQMAENNLWRKKGLKKNDFLKHVNAYILHPNEKYRNGLQEKYDYLIQCLEKATEFYQACKSEDGKLATVIFEKYAWFLFESDIQASLRRKENLFNALKELVNSYKEKEFVSFISKSWNLRGTKLILQWKRNAHIYQSYIKAPKDKYTIE